MVALQFEDKEKVFFHLGYGVSRYGSDGVSQGGINAHALAQVEEACDNLTSSYMVTQVLDQLTTLDMTYEAVKLVQSDTGRFSIKEILLGDTNRTNERQDVRDITMWRKEYLAQTEELAMMLSVVNFRQTSAAQYRFARSGTEYIKSIAGVADTAVASKIAEFRNLAGAVGY